MPPEKMLRLCQALFFAATIVERVARLSARHAVYAACLRYAALCSTLRALFCRDARRSDVLRDVARLTPRAMRYMRARRVRAACAARAPRDSARRQCSMPTRATARAAPHMIYFLRYTV